MLHSIFINYYHIIPDILCIANLLSHPQIIFGHIFVCFKKVLKEIHVFMYNQNVVIRQLTSLSMVTSAHWKSLAKTHCCHLVLLDKHCLGLIFAFVRHHPFHWGLRGRISVTLARILVINYLGSFCLFLLTLIFE